MTSIFLSVFILTFFLCLLTYILYPLAVWIIGKILKPHFHRSEITPFVSIVISAYNEINDIENKIRNTLELDYPKEKVEILIGSDGSTDGTPDAVKKFSDKIIFRDYKINRGKTTVQNELVQESRGEIIVFTDAASFLPKDALKKLVRNFADARIGCVAGRMVFVDTDSNMTTQSQGLYWKYESTIRELESMLGSLIGVDGPLYAVRKNAYKPLQPNIISDLITPLLVLEQGQKVILEPEALVEEKPTSKGKHEFTTRRRITLRGLIGIFSHPEMLHPFRHPLLLLQIACHKLIRWFVGPLVVLHILSCLVLVLRGYKLLQVNMFLYILFFIAALVGWALAHSGRKVKFFTVPYYFCLVNAAATMGIVDFFRKKQAVTWKTVRN